MCVAAKGRLWEAVKLLLCAFEFSIYLSRNFPHQFSTMFQSALYPKPPFFIPKYIPLFRKTSAFSKNNSISHIFLSFVLLAIRPGPMQGRPFFIHDHPLRFERTILRVGQPLCFYFFISAYFCIQSSTINPNPFPLCVCLRLSLSCCY